MRGALVNPTAVGGQSPGEVSFIPSVLCDLPYVEQTFEMPAFDKSEPLVLELSYKSLADFDTGDRVLPGISLGASWTALPQQSSDSFQTVRVCLGERAYAPADTEGRGGPVTLELGPLNKPYSCPGSVGGVVFAIDHAQIVEAAEGECGDRPGVGPNHDAEGTNGWTFTKTGASQAGFVDGAGASGTRGARILQVQRCDTASMATTLNVPDVPNPALELYAAASAQAPAVMTLGAALRYNFAPGSTGTQRICLPPALRGSTERVSFSFVASSGACADVLNHSLLVDELRGVDDPSCGSTGDVVNASFEHSTLWSRSVATNGNNPTTAEIRTGSDAHSGASYLVLETTARCTAASVMTSVIVPEPVGNAGPAVTVWSKIGANPDASTTLNTPELGGSNTLPENGVYEKSTRRPLRPRAIRCSIRCWASSGRSCAARARRGSRARGRARRDPCVQPGDPGRAAARHEVVASGRA